jgi:peroxiredoxin
MINYIFKTASALLLSAAAFAQAANRPFNNIKNSKSESAAKVGNLAGRWKGIFHVKEGLDVPFLFEITGNSPNEKIYFINAEEHFYGGKLVPSNDSIHVPLDQFDNELVLKSSGSTLTGFLRRQDGTGTPLSLEATKGNLSRFAETNVTPAAEISGTYDIIFKNENGKDEKAVGLFKQDGNKLKATFLRITGDSRYLDGIVTGNNFYLSTFIGSGPGYYTGTINKDGSITGSIVNARGGQAFSGIHNEEAALPDAYKLTYLKDGYPTLDFSFPDVNGKPVSLKDDKYKNKVVLVTITGSWCPNCIDEAAFLASWYKKNKKRGVEIISIHYERKTDTAYARKVISRFKERFGIDYGQVFAGLADKQHVAESLPALNTFLSFPTTIFIDRQGKVNKIHTGFSGPATGKYYDEFIKEFNTETDALLK